MSNTKNVTAAKPKIGGAVSYAPVGSKLPVDAAAELDTAFKPCGYISEDGFTNANKPESDDKKAWGGDIVASISTGRADTFKCKFIESTNENVLKLVYGDDNVTGTLEAGMTVKANSNELESHAFVVDMVLKGGILKRIVVPEAKLSDLADIVYKDDDITGYETTLTALPDTAGNTHYEYLKQPTAA